MTDQELQKLAREYAEEYSAINFLRWLTKTHCIVSREMIMAEYADAKATRDLYMSATCINTMESRAIDHSNGRMYELNKLFGKSTFEERSEE